MKVKVSVTTKLLAVVSVMMLTVTIVIAAMLITESQNNIEQQHQDFQLKNQRQLSLMEELLTVRLLVWGETFSRWGGTETLSESELAVALEESQESLSMSLQVSDMWLFGPEGQLLIGESNAMPSFVPTMEAQTRISMRPQDNLLCTGSCFRYLSVPIMIDGQRLAVLVLSSNFGELLAALSQFSSAYKIAVVESVESNNGDFSFNIVSRLSESNAKLLNNLLADIPRGTTAQDMVEKGVLQTLGNQDLLLSLLPITASNGGKYAILFVRDISDRVASVEEYQNMVIGTAVSIFLLFTIVLLILIQQYRRKLIQLTEQLPLLAEHRYKEFTLGHRRHRQWKDKTFPDELDLLEETARNVAKRLEVQDSKLAASNAQLENMSMFDGLTGLPNRTMMTFQIEKQISVATKSSGLAAVLFLDLDDFKKVNDSHGHDVGDKLLSAAAERLVNAVGDKHVVARFGGDEFVVLLNDAKDKAHVEGIAQSVLDVFNRPIQIDSMPFYISTSVGVAMTSQPDIQAVELLRHADIAMYEAKAQKGASFKLYDASMNVKVMRKVELEQEARVALRENQFSLALQPQIDIQTNKVTGFEALIRWRHPVKGPISPGEFIPLLESTPFMMELDYWVMTRSLRILNELSTSGYPDIKMAINVSAAQFSDPTLPHFLSQQLSFYELAPEKVELELTETALVSDINSAIDVCKALQDMGCLVAIDDFGTGYSSLSYLKSLPVDYIKIDQSFISGMLENADDKNIVQSTISLVRSLGRTVIAEGVETPEQLAQLGAFHCHQAQGYLISAPIPEAELWQRLEEQVVDGCWQMSDKVSSSLTQHQFEF